MCNLPYPVCSEVLYSYIDDQKNSLIKYKCIKNRQDNENRPTLDCSDVKELMFSEFS